MDVTATNLIAPQHGYYSTRYAYFDELGVVVLAEATGLAATTGDGAPLGVRVETEPDSAVSYAVVDLPRNLNYRDTQTIRLTYVLPDQGARRGVTRINPAYTSVVPIAVGDPGKATVRVVVPPGHEVEVLGSSPLGPEAGGDPHTYVAAAIADPVAWDAILVLRDGDRFERTAVTAAGGAEVEVLSWPGDAEWAAFVADHVTRGQPQLEALVGQPWPVDGTLEIEETVSPYLYGYAGWYDSITDRIEIGDELDPIVVLHEVAHAWFNRDLFAERWINEGFAEEVASRALAAMGQPLPQPDPVDPADPGAIRLADWSTPSLSSSISDDQERYGYNTAFAVLRILYDELGVDVMADVIAAAADDRIAYRGDPAPERDVSPIGWQRFLDLLENVGGSQLAGPMFGTDVVPEAGQPLLATRTDARAAYIGLAEAGSGWTPPLAVRRAMARWDFAGALAAMEEARAVLAQRDQLVATVAPLGLGAPTGLEADYESSEDLAATAATAAELLAVAADLATARAAVDADRDVWAAIGSVGGQAEGALADAEAAFEAGDPAGVRAASARALAAVDGADDLGRAAAAAALLALVVLVLAVRRGAVGTAAALPGRGAAAVARARERRRARRPVPALLPPPRPEDRLDVEAPQPDLVDAAR